MYSCGEDESSIIDAPAAVTILQEISQADVLSVEHQSLLLATRRTLPKFRNESPIFCRKCNRLSPRSYSTISGYTPLINSHRVLPFLHSRTLARAETFELKRREGERVFGFGNETMR